MKEISNFQHGYKITSFEVNFQNPGSIYKPNLSGLENINDIPESRREKIKSYVVLATGAVLLGVFVGSFGTINRYLPILENYIFPKPAESGGNVSVYKVKKPEITENNCPEKIPPYKNGNKKRFTFTGQEIPENEVLNLCFRK